MASGQLPDSENVMASPSQQLGSSTSETSLSKYFGQPDSGEDVFSVIAKPVPVSDSNLVSKTESVPSGNLNKQSFIASGANDMARNTSAPTATSQKEEDAGPKIFSYFAKSEVASVPIKDPVGKDFFDLLSDKGVTSKSASKSSDMLNEPAVAVSAGEKISHPTFYEADYEKRQKTWTPAEEISATWWIPSAAMESELKAVINSAGNFTPDKNSLTAPSLSTDVELGDPLGDLLRHYDGDAAALNRTVLTADSVTQDDRGIRHLIQAGFFRAAINLCGRLLTAYGQGFGRSGQVSKHTPHSLQLWFTRLALLVKTEQFSVAETEAAAFGDLNRADMYFQYYPELYGSKKGTMVPFGMRLLLAQLPSFAAKINEAQQLLHQILTTVRNVLQRMDSFTDDKYTAADIVKCRELWASRERAVLHCLINTTLMQKDYRSAISLLKQQLKDPLESKGSILSILGRVYLQFGDVKSAQAAFRQAADLRDKSVPASAVANLVDSALVAVAQNSFAEALRCLEQALQLDPHNPLVINNKAVCLLYMGQMHQSMQYLEESVGTRPDVMLLDPTVLNVCTLYELETSLTMQRKLGMLRLASQWRSDSFNVHNFKLQL